LPWSVSSGEGGSVYPAYPLIGASISLAGFVLASLTIIITFRDNINHKEIVRKIEKKEKLDGIELIFCSRHYKRIVGVFSWACFIFLIIFASLSIIKLIAYSMDVQILLDFTIFALVLISLTIFRSLLILYNIIKLQVNQIEEIENV